MRKFVFLAVVGAATTGLLLAAPAESRADHRHHSGLNIGVGNGGVHVDYSRGGRGYGSYYGNGILPGGCVAPGSYYGSGYGGYYTPRPVIVQPTDLHWTPYRGWHEHGDILVPHRGHYHRSRY